MAGGRGDAGVHDASVRRPGTDTANGSACCRRDPIRLCLHRSRGMRRIAQPTVDESDMDIEFIDLPGEQIPLDDNSVDTVLVTYTLCTIADTKMALEGMRRVLRPGGKLFFCEHGKAPDENVQRWQNRLSGTLLIGLGLFVALSRRGAD